MPAQLIMVHDLKDPSDPRGRSFREVNADRGHRIPLGALVELDTGVRLFVVNHNRDCDMTPLYYLSADRDDTTQEHAGRRNRGWVGGFSETSLAEVKPRRNQT